MHALSPRRTVFLTERVPHRTRLAPADVTLLVERYRGKVDVLPTRRRDCYCLTALGCVGTLVTPNCRFIIGPKIPLANVLLMLAPLATIPCVPDATTPITGTEVLEFLTGQLLGRLRERFTTGLHRTYRERQEQGPLLLGRLDLPSQFRDAPGRKDRLHGIVDDWSADLSCNRVLRATVELLVASPFIREETRTVVQQTIPEFSDVSSVPLSADLWQNIDGEQVPDDYQALLDLCRLLVESLTPGSVNGKISSPAFLLDMEQVFERYITRCVVSNFDHHPRYRVEVQRTRTVNQQVADVAGITMRPDLTIASKARIHVVVDAKWKRFRGQVDTPDLYQIIAYGTALGAEEVALIYPGTRWVVREYAFTHSPLRLTVISLRVVGSRQVCDHSLNRLGRFLHARLRGA